MRPLTPYFGKKETFKPKKLKKKNYQTFRIFKPMAETDN